MTDDDDWFERALQEDGEDAEGADGDGAAVPPGGEAAEDVDGDDGGAAGDGVERDDVGPEPIEDEGTSGAGGMDGAGDGAGDGASAGDAEGPDGLFDDDFASALEGASGPGGVEGPDPGGGGFGPGGFDGGPGGGPGFDEFGVDGPVGGDFAEEPYDSDIDRVDVGVEGLDEMIQGGIPERSLIAVIGSAGTGKTTFGLQFVQHGLAEEEGRAVYITLEEGRDDVVRSAEEKGWDYQAYVEEGRLAVVDMDPIEMANSLGSIRGELPRLIEEFGATRLVLDSVSLLELMYDDPATRRNEVYEFARSLEAAGVTTVVTSEASRETPYASRHGIVEYLTDAVFVLQYVRPSDFRETRLAVEIQKIRDANHSREMKPYEITDDGLNVYRQANIF